MKLRLLLIQARDAADPMRTNEAAAFVRALAPLGDEYQLQWRTHNAIEQPLRPEQLNAADLVLVGGSGAYSVLDDLPWVHALGEGLRMVCERRVPMFASCFGFQALAQALGGVVEHDAARGELGTFALRLTEAGRQDPLFGTLPMQFAAHLGHEDLVTTLPAEAVCLATSERAGYQAYRIVDRPIYATQFHPELTVDDMLARVARYPEYLELATGLSFAAYAESLAETPESGTLLPGFVRRLAQGQW